MADMNGLKEHHQRITERMQHLMQQPSALGRDMLLEELRRCYDMVLTMPLTVEKPVVEAPKATPQPAVEAASAPHSVAHPLEPAQPEIPIVAPIVETATAAMNAQVEEEPAQVETEALPEPPKTEVGVPKPELVESAPRLAVKAEKENNEAILAGKLNNKPIADLRSGIPLNEKFGIIRNLFAGNASDFGDAVLKLNSFENVNELKQHFQFLTQRKDWDMESESYQIFLSYVERKAGTLEG
jgi:hypothetical protein